MNGCFCAPRNKQQPAKQKRTGPLHASSLDELSLDRLMQQLRDVAPQEGPRYTQVGGVLQVDALIQRAKTPPKRRTTENTDHA